EVFRTTMGRSPPLPARTASSCASSAISRGGSFTKKENVMFQFTAKKKNEGRRPAIAQRTRIEDLSAVGEELSNADLQLVHGGLTCSWGPGQSATTQYTGSTDTRCGSLDACDVD